MDYLLNDLVEYTMEKMAAEEDMSEEERYNQELAKAKKRKLIGLGLTGGGLAGALGVGIHWGKEVNELMDRRDQEALDRQKSYANAILGPGVHGGVGQAIDQMNRAKDQADMAKKLNKRTIIPRAAFLAGTGTLAYNNLKKNQARLRYEAYLKSKEE